MVNPEVGRDAQNVEENERVAHMKQWEGRDAQDERGSKQVAHSRKTCITNLEGEDGQVG